MRIILCSAGLILAATPGRLPAQQTPASAPVVDETAPAPAAQDDYYADPADVVVTARRATEPGAVVGDIKPELQLDPADIRSYGVSSIGDLLTELAPETESGRGSGRPAVLLSGKRISDFRELRDLPTEAILRVDILPEQVALDYGFAADQKVVNIVLRRHFHSQTLEARDSIATDGGRNSPHGSLGIVNINPNGRFSLNLDYKESNKLLESQRDLTGAPSDGVFDIAGNITPAPGAAEIDPGLSALAGAPVTIAGVPATAANGAPALGDFAATANQANVTNLAPYRTLLPSTHDFTANAVYARTIFGNVSATINGSFELSDSTDDLGLPGIGLAIPAGNPFSPFSDDVRLNRYIDAGNPLRQSSQSVTSHAGATFNGRIDTWNWNLTANYDRVDTKSLTDTGIDASAFQAALDANDPTANPFGALSPPLIGPAPSDIARSTSNSGKLDALINGSLLTLPAGSLSTSLHIGAQTNDFTSNSFRGGVIQSGDVSRDSVNGRLNLNLPITSRSKHFLGAIGDLSANLNLAADHLSDFGTQTTVGYGLHWSPIDAVRALVSFTDQGDAPSAQQLGNPLITTPNARVFDYVRGQTVDITRISGGNPGLAADQRHVFEAELNVKPLSKVDLRITANYVATRTRNAIASLPAATADIEQAFPDRFIRDASGTLVSVDSRPINLDEEDTKKFRWGFRFTQRLKSKRQRAFEAYRNGTGPNPLAGLRRHHDDTPPPPADGKAPPPPEGGKTPPPAGGGTPPPPPSGGRGPGGFGGHHGFGRHGGGGGGGGRLKFAVYHTWRLEDQIHTRAGLPVLDLLDGAAGTQPRHEVEVQAGYYNNGFGARLSADWHSGTHVDGGTAGAPDTLDFSPLTTLNLRLFADLSAQTGFVRDHPWARGMRIKLSAKNLLNSRQRVTDAAGMTPISYQPDYIDPLGRTVMISIRKLFFQRSNR